MAKKTKDIDNSFDQLNDSVKSITADLLKLNLNSVSKDLYKSFVSLTEEVKNASKNVGNKNFDSSFSFYSEANALLKKIKEEKILESNFDDFGRGVVVPQLNMLKDLVFKLNDVLYSIRDSHDALVESIIKNLDVSSETNEFMKPFYFVLDKIESIPFGSTLIKSFKIDEFKEKIEENITYSLARAFYEGENGFGTLANVALKAISTVGNGLLTLLLNPIVLIVGSVAAISAMFIKSQKASRDFLETFGLTLDETSKFRYELEDAAKSLTKFGIETEDIYNSAASIYNKLQNINIISKDMVKNVSKLAANFGLTSDESVELYDKLNSMNKGSEDMSKNWIGILISMSDIIGTPIRDVFKDIVENSELISKYFKGNTKELARTVIESRQLGLNLSKIGSLFDKIMDFETSIGNEMEASILLGKSINLNKARQLVFDGKINEATKETFNQLGLSLDKFNSLNMYQKEAISDLVGQSISELESSLLVQQKINSLDKDKQKQYDKYVQLLESGKNITGEQIFDQQRQQYILKDMVDSIKSIATSLSRIILPVIYAIEPIITYIADLFESISDFINSLIDDTNNWWSKLLKAALTLGVIFTSIKLIKLALLSIGKLPGLGSIFGGLGGVSTPGAGKISGGIKSFFDVFSSINLKSIAGFALVSAVLIASLYGLSFALKQFNDVDWDSAVIGMGSLLALVGIIALIGTVMSSGIGTVAILAGVSAIALLAGAIWLIGDSLNNMSKSIPVFSKFFSTISNIGNELFVAASGIMAIATSLMYFSSSAMLGGLMTFFSSDPIRQFERIASISDDLLQAANNINKLTDAVSNFDKINSKINDYDNLYDNLSSISDIYSELNINNNDDYIIEAIDNIVKSNEKNMEEIINSIKDMKVYMDSKLVGRIMNKNISSISMT